MTVSVRSGYHSRELFDDVRAAWRTGDRLLLVTSPTAASSSPSLAAGADAGSSLADYVSLLERTEWPAAPVLGVFTSGTVSGHPRLVVYSRRNIEASLEAVMALFDRKRITSIFSYPQPFHTFGLTLGYLLAEYLDVPLHFHSGKYSPEAHAVRASIKDEGLLTLGTPAHFYDLVRSGHKLAPSYSAIIGGASVDPQLWRDVRDLAKIEQPSIGYGCTEAAPAITHLAPGVEPRVAGEIGFPLKNLHSHSITGHGVEISGDSLCMAIVDNGRVTFPRKLTIADDIHVRADASWIFKGRLDLVINRGGVKIALEDVERLIRDRLGIAAVAFPIPSERLGQDLGIAVLAKQAETQALVSDHFNMKPNVFHTAEFPLNASGKIDRQQVAKDGDAVKIAELEEFLPHRPPAIWIDEVDQDASYVDLKKEAAYFSQGRLRESSLIEFIAQSFGYQLAAQIVRAGQKPEAAKKAFLVAVTKCTLADTSSLRDKDRLKITIGDVKSLGPITMFNAQVTASDGTEYARASLKVFSE